MLYIRQLCNQVAGGPQGLSGWPVDFNLGCSLHKLLTNNDTVAAEPLLAMCPSVSISLGPGSPRAPHAKSWLLPGSDTFCSADHRITEC